MSTTLYHHGLVRSPDHPTATAVLVRGDAVVWVGDEPERWTDQADHQVDLAGALVTPAFVDAHVHATSTGLALTGLDLTAATSLADCLSRVESAGRRARGGIVLGHGWDETALAGAAPADEAGARPGVVRRRGLPVARRRPLGRRVLGPAGRGPGGPWRGRVHRRAATCRVPPTTSSAGSARESVTSRQRRAVQRAALDRAASLGVGCVHELAGPDISSAEDLTALLELARDEPAPEVVAYWGELGAEGVARARRARGGGRRRRPVRRRLHRLAHRCPARPVRRRRPPRARLPRRAGRSATTWSPAREAGLQAGFHAIGDGALDAVAGGFALAGEQLGDDRVRSARHRVEHVEMVSPEAVEVLARLGVVASVQPAFDRLWGGDGRDVRPAAGRRASTVPQPVRGHAPGRRRAGPRLGLTGHADRPVGRGARRCEPPHRRLTTRAWQRPSTRTPAAAGWPRTGTRKES